MERIEWSGEAAAHIRTRSDRYPDAIGIEPEWTAEAINDPDRTLDEPDLKSAHANGVRIIGYSPTARMIITVVALRDPGGTLHGASAWKASRAERRRYEEGTT